MRKLLTLYHFMTLTDLCNPESLTKVTSSRPVHQHSKRSHTADLCCLEINKHMQSVYLTSARLLLLGLDFQIISLYRITEPRKKKSPYTDQYSPGGASIKEEKSINSLTSLLSSGKKKKVFLHMNTFKQRFLVNLYL